MCWQAGRARRWGLLAGCLLAAGAVTGCARPQGPLFPPRSQAVVWPPAPESPRIRWVGAVGSSKDLNAGRSGAEAFKAALRGPRPPIKLASPHGVAVQPAGIMAVADGAAGAIHLIDLRTRTHRRVTGWEDQRLSTPLGVAWVGDRLFVTDARRHEVIVFDDQGRYQRRFGADVLSRPVGIAYASRLDRLYVVDGQAHCVRAFDLTGKVVRTIGQRGSGPGEFNFPTHIACRGDRLLVADSGNFRVQLMDLEGTCLRIIGQKGDGAGDFSLPKGVAINSEGLLYVLDAQFENVQIFDPQGRLLLAFGREGQGAGQFWLPAGLAIDENDRIYVADSANRRICVFDTLRASG